MKTTVVFSSALFYLLVVFASQLVNPELASSKFFPAAMLVLGVSANVLACLLSLEVGSGVRDPFLHALASAMSIGITAFVGFAVMGKVWGCDFYIIGFAFCGFVAGFLGAGLTGLLFYFRALFWSLVRRCIKG